MSLISNNEIEDKMESFSRDPDILNVLNNKIAIDLFKSIIKDKPDEVYNILMNYNINEKNCN